MFVTSAMEKLLVWTVVMELVHQAEAKAELGLLESLIVAANARPWLWSVYVMSVGLPIILFISFMWPDKRFGPPDQPYYYKKTDDIQEDDLERPPRSKPAPVSTDKAKDTGPRKRDVHKHTMKSDLELKVE